MVTEKISPSPDPIFLLRRTVSKKPNRGGLIGTRLAAALAERILISSEAAPLAGAASRVILILALQA